MSQTAPTQDPAVVAVIGAGPAGLMAAEVLSEAGVQVVIHERMASAGRKLLMAGRGGLNLTHSEPLETFLSRYREAEGWIRGPIGAFSPADLAAWAEGLGQEVFTGSSGRVFPRAMKASPLLRAWLARLSGRGVSLLTRSDWRGWTTEGELAFADGTVQKPAATVLALGGASWPRLGSDGQWVSLLAERGLDVAPLQPANVGFNVAWTPEFVARFAGQPLKAIAVTCGDQTVRGEALVAAYGLEGGAIYALSAELRAALARDGHADVRIDLRPDASVGRLTARLSSTPRGSQSLSNHLRKVAGLSPVAISLMREATGGPLPDQPTSLAGLIKAVPVRLLGPRGLDRAISTAGGLTLDQLDRNLMIRDLPGVFAAGEMLDWEAPTGGYLLQGCLATGAAAGRGVVAWLGRT